MSPLHLVLLGCASALFDRVRIGGVRRQEVEMNDPENEGANPVYASREP